MCLCVRVCPDGGVARVGYYDDVLSACRSTFVVLFRLLETALVFHIGTCQSVLFCFLFPTMASHGQQLGRYKFYGASAVGAVAE